MLINDSIDQESIGDIVEKSQKLIYWFSSIDSELIFDPMTDEKSRELRIASRRVHNKKIDVSMSTTKLDNKQKFQWKSFLFGFFVSFEWKFNKFCKFWEFRNLKWKFDLHRVVLCRFESMNRQQLRVDESEQPRDSAQRIQQCRRSTELEQPRISDFLNV